MFEKELELIRVTEASADDLVKQAERDARTMVGNSRKQAEDIIEQAENHSAKIFAGYVKEGETIADSKYREIMEDATRKRADMEKDSKKRFSKAVSMIAERIVKCSVDN